METLEIAFTQHRGKINRQQQDCLLVNNTLHQARALPIPTLTPWRQMMCCSRSPTAWPPAPAPRPAGRTVLEALVKAVQEHPE